MKINKASEVKGEQAAELFQDTVKNLVLKNAPTLKFMRGNIKADVLLIAPPPTEEDLERETPFCSSQARIFHNRLLTFTNYDTEESFLVMSCSFTIKPSKASTWPARVLVEKYANEKLFKKYALIGSVALKYILGEGKSFPMSTFGGSTVYPPVLNGAPIFVFPQLDLLAPLPGSVPDWKWASVEGESARLFREVAGKFKRFMDL